MLVYIGIIGLWALLAVYSNRIALHGQNGTNYNAVKSPMFFLGIILIILCGLRAYKAQSYVGIDTLNYYRTFERVAGLSNLSAVAAYTVDDVGYHVLCWMVSKVGLGFWAILLLEAVVYIGAMLLAIKGYSKLPMLSMLIYISLGLYTFSFSTIRQSFAMGFCLIGYILMKRKCGIRGVFRFLLFVALAMTFHMSAVISIPILFIDRIKNKRRNILIMLVLAGMTMIFRKQFTSIILSVAGSYSTRYAEYQAGSGTVGQFQYLLIFAFVVLRLVFSKKISVNDDDNRMIFMLLFMLIIYPAVQSGGAMMRVYFYYFMFAPVCIANTVQDVSDVNIRNIVKLACVAFFIAYFFTTDFETLRLVPYSVGFLN